MALVNKIPKIDAAGIEPQTSVTRLSLLPQDHRHAVVAVSPLATVDLIDAVVELPVVVVVVDEDVVQSLLRCI